MSPYFCFQRLIYTHVFNTIRIDTIYSDGIKHIFDNDSQILYGERTQKDVGLAEETS